MGPITFRSCVGSYWINFRPISVLDLVLGPRNLICHVIMTTMSVSEYNQPTFYLHEIIIVLDVINVQTGFLFKICSPTSKSLLLKIYEQNDYSNGRPSNIYRYDNTNSSRQSEQCPLLVLQRRTPFGWYQDSSTNEQRPRSRHLKYQMFYGMIVDYSF